MSATAPFACLELGDTNPVAVPTASTATLYAGNLGAVDATGTAALASDTAGLRVVGRIEEDVVNGDNLFRGGPRTVMAQGAFQYRNSATHPLTQADLELPCFVQDSETVAKTSTNNVRAGIVVGIGSTDATGNPDPTQPFVWVDTTRADL